ncbi:BRCA1-associated RING domain protein 1-like isoform X2 [Dioscorea cayenensis subsp. rotundata]|uniref:BRCA1-associated RING domain protein 1-like isoform X2 n=1 Tax=Dioscorea cayennensis subsp. rotundata TaxID=55577 RepID=A0AB40BF16_DIOCR|nr:BRCA1-associated RING domain protein 1-like isoform X2 [Dioscorea cayenensis subsp. rotundata]
MAVPRRPIGVDGDDDGDEVAEFFEDDGDVLPDLDRDSPPHLRALADAAHRGDVEALRLAIDGHSGSIDDPVEDGDALLHLSCLYGHLPCVQLLLQRGANLEIRDEEGAIPLHDASAGDAVGNPDSINRMLNTVDAEGDTPLHHAARGEHLNVIQLLLATGASPKKTNIYGKIPAELADPGTEARRFLESANDG